MGFSEGCARRTAAGRRGHGRGAGRRVERCGVLALVIPPLSDCHQSVPGRGRDARASSRSRPTARRSHRGSSTTPRRTARATSPRSPTSVATTLGFKPRPGHGGTASRTGGASPQGPKPFDFDINEIVYAAKLDRRKVSFSSSYFNVNQSLVAVKGARIVTHHSPSALKTTSTATSSRLARPQLHPRTRSTRSARRVVFTTLAAAIAALEAKHDRRDRRRHPDRPVHREPAARPTASRSPSSTRPTEHYSLVLQQEKPPRWPASTPPC